MPACREFCARRSAAAAQERGLAGHVVTLSRSSVEPFLQFSARRDLREKVFRGLDRPRRQRRRDRQQGDHRRDGAAARRAGEAARLSDFAHYRLDDAMAKTPEAVRGLLDTVWAPARARALADRDALQELVARGGRQLRARAWDWRYYAEKLRQGRCDYR